jgi:hypothetical protein
MAAGCTGGAIVIALHGRMLDTEIASIARAGTDHVFAVCADGDCVSRARAIHPRPFPILSSCSYALAQAVASAEQDAMILFVDERGVVRWRSPVPHTDADSHALRQKLFEALHEGRS